MNWTTVAEWTVYAEPFGKQAMKNAVVCGHVHKYLPTESRNHIADIKMQSLQHRPATLINGPIRLTIKAYRTPPKAFSKKKLAMALADEIAPITKPDLDNIEKAVKDALTGIMWTDDARVVRHGEGHGKYYGEPARYEIKIETEAT